MDSTGKEQQIKVRCNTCRGTGIAVAGEGHDFPCLDCCGFGFTKEVFRLKPAPLTLREQLEASDPRNSPCATFDPSFGFKEQEDNG